MMNSKPLMIDGFCGLGGASEGFLAEGWECVGFDNERHDYGQGGYPGQLVLQDILTVHGKQFAEAEFLWFSPPCQEYSYMAMPWSRAKQIARALRGQDDFPEGYTGSRTIEELNALFNACFRIQREASESSGRHIPMIVENVRGAQPWVGRSAWNYGSFHLWGDVPALMPFAKHVKWDAGGSWFGVEPNGDTHPQRGPHGIKLPGNNSEALWADRPVSRLKDALKVPGFNFHQYEKTGKPGGSFQTAAIKGSDGGWFNDNKRDGKSAETGYLSQSGSKSPARKAASAQIAKIPLPLSRHIARVYYPKVEAFA